MRHLVAVLVAAAGTARASTCGDCWCVVDDNATGCPAEPHDYTNDTVTIAGLAAQRPTNAFRLPCDPYLDDTCDTLPPLPVNTTNDTVCALDYHTADCATYALRTFADADAADAAGAVVTHTGACGLCSTTQDLAAYMANYDMTAAGTKCGTEALLSPALGLRCFEALGLTRPCAEIWLQDAIYDTAACGVVCAKNLRADYNGPPPECALNPCLQCDEDEAGPLFKLFAGRTRRRSGLESAIARPCSSVASIEHEVCPTV